MGTSRSGGLSSREIIDVSDQSAPADREDNLKLDNDEGRFLVGALMDMVDDTGLCLDVGGHGQREADRVDSYRSMTPSVTRS